MKFQFVSESSSETIENGTATELQNRIGSRKEAKVERSIQTGGKSQTFANRKRPKEIDYSGFAKNERGADEG